MKMEQTECSETSAYKIQTPGNYSEENIQLTWTAYSKGGSTLVTLPRILTPYRDSVDGTRDGITYQKLVTR